MHGLSSYPFELFYHARPGERTCFGSLFRGDRWEILQCLPWFLELGLSMKSRTSHHLVLLAAGLLVAALAPEVLEEALDYMIMQWDRHLQEELDAAHGE